MAGIDQIHSWYCQSWYWPYIFCIVTIYKIDKNNGYKRCNSGYMADSEDRYIKLYGKLKD